MSVSFAQTTSLTCDRCGASFSAEVWLIVHGLERPDLLARARSGDLHRPACPSCAHVAEVDAPLVICRPDQSPPVLISPAAPTSEEQDRQTAGALLGQLRALLGREWQESWAEQIVVAHRSALPALLAGLDSPAERPVSPLSTDGMLVAVQSFLNARTLPESRAVIEAHPDLVGPEGVAVLAQLHEGARAAGQEGPAALFEVRRALIARCLEIGVAAAFAEKMTQASGQGLLSGLPPVMSGNSGGFCPETLADLEG